MTWSKSALTALVLSMTLVACGGGSSSSGTTSIATAAPNYTSANANVTTFAGSTVGLSGSTDGTGTAATFSRPNGIAIDSSGNFFVTDSGNQTIREITLAGVVTTFAGNVGVSGHADATGTAATFNNPTYLTIDSSNNIYVSDNQNNIIRKITSAGVVTTFAGTASVQGGHADGTGVNASFNYPNGIVIDSNGNLFVADTFNSTIRKITPAGVVTTFAGTAGVNGSTDGTGSAASFFYPNGIAIDSSNNLYVTDSNSNTIRKITPTGAVTTFAGSATAQPGTVDGTGTAATFNNPKGITFDSLGNLYVTDYGGQKIRKITTAGVVTTIAGSGQPGNINGLGTAASFNGPYDLVTDASGNLYIVELNNSDIRKISPQ